MKKIFLLLLLLTVIVSAPVKLYAQKDEIEQLTLNVEKLMQFKRILSDLKKGYQILNGGYNTIKNISQGNFNLHKDFLDGLMAVSPTVRNYKKIADIIGYQKSIIQEYKSAYSRFKSNGFFNDDEMGYISGVYDNLLKKSLNNLDDLTMVITANKLRMSDDERLEAIDKIDADMRDKLDFLHSFNNNTSVLAAQRAKEQNDVNAMRSIHGINQ
jgi:hypothetical protein